VIVAGVAVFSFSNGFRGSLKTETLFSPPDDYWCGGADINRDGVVDDKDHDMVSNRWSFPPHEAGNEACFAPDWCDNVDINQDGFVHWWESGYVLERNGMGGCNSGSESECTGDIDGDGLVGGDDLDIVGSNWGCTVGECSEKGRQVLEVTRIINDTTGFNSDSVRFQDIKTGYSYDVAITAEGVGTVSIDGTSYTVWYFGNSYNASEETYIIIVGPGVYNQKVFNDNFVVLGDEGNSACTEYSCKEILRVQTITNGSSGFNGDKVTLRDIKTGYNYDVSITAEGVGTVSYEGISYQVNYFASPNTMPYEDRYITIVGPPGTIGDQKVFYDSYVVIDDGELSDCGGADISGDGQVGGADLDIVRINWGQTCAASICDTLSQSTKDEINSVNQKAIIVTLTEEDPVESFYLYASTDYVLELISADIDSALIDDDDCLTKRIYKDDRTAFCEDKLGARLISSDGSTVQIEAYDEYVYLEEGDTIYRHRGETSFVIPEDGGTVLEFLFEGSATADVRIKDRDTGEDIPVTTIDEGSATFNMNGNDYWIARDLNDSVHMIKVTWGSGATYGDVGDVKDDYSSCFYTS
jgi:hypothetical protein